MRGTLATPRLLFPSPPFSGLFLFRRGDLIALRLFWFSPCLFAPFPILAGSDCFWAHAAMFVESLSGERHVLVSGSISLPSLFSFWPCPYLITRIARGRGRMGMVMVESDIPLVLFSIGLSLYRPDHSMSRLGPGSLAAPLAKSTFFFFFSPSPIHLIGDQ